ncbi:MULTISPECIES: hypothetical protein [unclassified Klebsiella]|uniref:hypothetical protein n=1 Tax=Enterobacteriaceae TaxID=543 RepID=UPI0015DC06AD|nr:MULTISPECIES: hypothetical protein [unclassified Klebsiella]BBR59204.1 hypothetical protein WP4W18E05_25720 [Klebsiella sp. WP4-W18-ESBL-05]BBS91429.1 hypothetical protein WP7S18C02_20440 [Klebsiella sp. WP7-S18-CRE-02]BBS96451.1 hypothetical protein WP7S18C03_20440 [Klebsiella sp. WP7-S18-CRE-03]BBT01483.1 hypothetical protein WP7S18E04_20450 [Klebsiella sp. WP7-S18-ESBL-04]
MENNKFGFDTGTASIGAANASWNQYAVDNNLTPEETQAELDKIAKGDMPDSTNRKKLESIRCNQYGGRCDWQCD